MKVLTALTNTNAVQIALADLMFDDRNVIEVAKHWAIFPRQYLMALDIAKNGMKYPIIVKREASVLRFVASGCRIQYAVLNGYTHIDALLFNSDEEIQIEVKKQQSDDAAILLSFSQP